MANLPTIKSNGPIHVLVKTIHGVPASASEAVTASIFIDSHYAISMVNTLVEFGHLNLLVVPIEKDNSNANDILTAQVNCFSFQGNKLILQESCTLYHVDHHLGKI